MILNCEELEPRLSPAKCWCPELVDKAPRAFVPVGPVLPATLDRMAADLDRVPTRFRDPVEAAGAEVKVFYGPLPQPYSFAVEIAFGARTGMWVAEASNAHQLYHGWAHLCQSINLWTREVDPETDADWFADWMLGVKLTEAQATYSRRWHG